MRVLVACEFSGVVREAFRKRGHDAWSCDLLPTLIPSAFHLQEDAIEVAYGRAGPYTEWDLMIAHPPCTYLCNSGSKHLYIDGKKENGPNPTRWQKMYEAEDFFNTLLEAPIDKICVENPVPHGHFSIRKYDQKVQPWMFGHPEKKGTCFWLKNLDPLQPTMLLPPPYKARVANEGPGPDRWMRRSITYQGIADAMAQQWG